MQAMSRVAGVVSLGGRTGLARWVLVKGGPGEVATATAGDVVNNRWNCLICALVVPVPAGVVNGRNCIGYTLTNLVGNMLFGGTLG